MELTVETGVVEAVESSLERECYECKTDNGGTQRKVCIYGMAEIGYVDERVGVPLQVRSNFGGVARRGTASLCDCLRSPSQSHHFVG